MKVTTGHGEWREKKEGLDTANNQIHGDEGRLGYGW